MVLFLVDWLYINDWDENWVKTYWQCSDSPSETWGQEELSKQKIISQLLR